MRINIDCCGWSETGFVELTPRHVWWTFVDAINMRVWVPHYKMTQQPLCFLWSPLRRLCLVAASKTSSTPSPVSEEHSRYFFAPMRLRTSSPSSATRNFSDRLRISSCATGSSRRSFLRPTRMIGTPGQRSRTSGCLLHVSNEFASINIPSHAIVPFSCDVLQGIRAGDGKRYQYYVGLAVSERS